MRRRPAARTAAGDFTPGARDVALEVLRRVEATGAFANLLLDSRLRDSALAAADRALVTELAYGVLRWRGRLDWILAQLVDRPLHRLEAVVLDCLRLGVYQLCALSRVPAFAAVDETVALVRRAGAARSAGYVNAVLRAVAGHGPFAEPDPATDPLAYWSGPGSHPRWLAERWLRRWGPAEGAAVMAANNAVPPLTVVVNLARCSAADAAARLRGREAEPGRLSPLAYRLRGAGSPEELPGFAQGCWIPMDEGGLLPVLALAPEPGDRVLDACAGGGGKTALIAARVVPGGEVVALDRSPRAIGRLQTAVVRLGLGAVRAELGDARTAGREARFRKVLLDVPCTGLGTVRRRPEIKWRRRPADVTAAQRVQRELLRGAAEAVAPGGHLVYSTCSLEPEETDEVIDAFLDQHPTFSLDDLEPVLGLPDLVEAGKARSRPDRHDSDGFFVARLRRRA